MSNFIYKKQKTNNNYIIDIFNNYDNIENTSLYLYLKKKDKKLFCKIHNYIININDIYSNNKNINKNDFSNKIKSDIYNISKILQNYIYSNKNNNKYIVSYIISYNICKKIPFSSSHIRHIIKRWINDYINDL